MLNVSSKGTGGRGGEEETVGPTKEMQRGGSQDGPRNSDGGTPGKMQNY